jgi:hypothetical protein
MQKSGLSRDTESISKQGSLTGESPCCLQSIPASYEEIMPTPLAVQQLKKVFIISSLMEVDHV